MAKFIIIGWGDVVVVVVLLLRAGYLFIIYYYYIYCVFLYFRGYNKDVVVLVYKQ
jgi:hypothetical protein